MGKQQYAGADQAMANSGVKPWRRLELSVLSICLGLMLGACDMETAPAPEAPADDMSMEHASVPDRPAPVFEGKLEAPRAVTLTRSVSQYDGSTDDLLSAGLGLEGLRANLPEAAVPPQAGDLRRMAIYHAYRGLMDLRPGGSLEQAQRADGKPILEPIAGIEVLALRQLGDMNQPSAVLLQIPDTFDWQSPCLVVSATSGSRGIYGAVPVIAHWALPRHCAVVYTEKGTGNGINLPSAELGYRVTGEMVSVYQAAFDPQLDEELSEARWDIYLEEHPHRIAFRHAHSSDNPEAHWGEFLIDAVYFTLDELNVRRPQETDPITQDDIVIIAAGISNAGGTALAAVEMDDIGLFDGIAVSEPNVFVPGAPALFDTSTQANLYAACAVQALPADSHPLAAVLGFQASLFNQRCTNLADAGLLDPEKGDLPQQALEKMHELGYPASADPLLAFAVSYDLYPAIAATYASSYGRFRFYEPPCGVGFAYTSADGVAMALPDDKAEFLFATSSGVVPTAEIQLVKKGSDGMDRRAALVPGYSDKPDADLASALCHRELMTKGDEKAKRVQAGVEATVRNGNLRGRPAYIVHGAADNVVPIRHSSQAYAKLNKEVEGQHSRLEYIEVSKGQHFDALMALPIYQDHYEPLHPHYLAALDRLWQELAKAD